MRIPSNVVQFAPQQNLAPIHRAAMNGDHSLMLKMINKIRDESMPLPEIVQTSAEQRIEQVKSQRDKLSHARYEIVNKKNKVGSIEGVGLIIALLLQYGWTALHYAADGGCVSVVQVLLMEKECDVAMTTKVNTVRLDIHIRSVNASCT